MKTKNKRGFTLIETMITIGIIAIVLMAFFETFGFLFRSVLASKQRLVAVAIMRQYIEMAQNLSYADVGTIGDLTTPGLLPASATEIRNGATFTVSISADYIDDSDDGTFGGTPNDVLPTDYKKVAITVSWNTESLSQELRIVPPGLETMSGGILSVNVLTSSGDPVTNAAVTVRHVGTGASKQGTTDAFGNLLILGVPADGEKHYEITVVKGGYETVTTYAPLPTSAFNPIDEHVAIVEGALTSKTIVANPSATIALAPRLPTGDAIGDFAYTVTGGRVIGHLPDTTPVTAVNQAFVGNATLANVSGGSYTITVDGSETRLLWKAEPAGALRENFTAVAGDQNVVLVIVDPDDAGILATVKDQGTGLPIAGATVRLQNGTLVPPFDQSETTDVYGMVFFSDESAAPLIAGTTYDGEVSHAGHQTETTSWTPNALIQPTVLLDAP